MWIKVCNSSSLTFPGTAEVTEVATRPQATADPDQGRRTGRRRITLVDPSVPVNCRSSNSLCADSLVSRIAAHLAA
jgi:hypothetical protein